MATALDYEEIDFAFVREEIFGEDEDGNPWVPDPLPSTGWAGIVPENEYLVPDPAPASSGPPTIYAAWSLIYDDVDGDFEDIQAPIRSGRLMVARYLQKGARTGYNRILRRAILARLADVADGPLGFSLQESRTITVGFVGPWFVQNLAVPFSGGG